MHYDVLVPVVEELSSLLTGARVQRVLQGEDGGLYLLFRRDRKNFVVLLSPDRSLPRLHLVSRKPGSASDPHPLVLNLRSRLPGGRLAHIGLLNDERKCLALLGLEPRRKHAHRSIRLDGQTCLPQVGDDRRELIVIETLTPGVGIM